MRVKPAKLLERPEASVIDEGVAGEGKVRLRVDGMVCDICAGRVRRALEGLDAVRRAEVDLDSGEALVELSGPVSAEQMVRAVEGKVILSWARGALARLRGRDA